MDDFSYLLKNALEYYDDARMHNYDIYRKIKFYDLDTVNKKIVFYDKNKEQIFLSQYEVIGSYLHNTKVWLWGWAISELDSKHINIARRVLNYALDLDKKNYVLKTELITSRHQISSNVQLDILLAIASYLSKKPNIYKLNYSKKTSTNHTTDLETNKRYYPITKDVDAMGTYYLALI